MKALRDGDKFAVAEGVLRVGPRSHTLAREYGDGINGGRINFPNGHSISVAWGPHNYSGKEEFPTHVETAHFSPTDEFVPHPTRDSHDDVQSYMNHEEVNKFIDYIKGL